MNRLSGSCRRANKIIISDSFLIEHALSQCQPAFTFSCWPHREERFQSILRFLLRSSARPPPSPHSRCQPQLLYITLRASFSDTFLQTLPNLVTPVKGHSLSPRSCPATRSAPSERFGYYYDCRSNLAPKHARKQEAHPPRVKKRRRRVPSRFKRFWFELA